MPVDKIKETFGTPRQTGPMVSEAVLKKVLIQLNTNDMGLIYEYDGDIPDAHFKFTMSDVPGLEQKVNGIMESIHNHVKAQL